MQAGDQNSKYFHACAKNKRKRSQILRLKNDEGDWVDWESGLKAVMEEYYRKLFSASDTNWSRVTENITQEVTGVQNSMLLAPVEAAEVRKALFQMHPDKSSGPDGFNPGFYQKYWDVVGNDVVKLVQNAKFLYLW